jgi:hypothetical protein
MAAMVMLVIVLASFLQVESRLAQSHSGHQRAKLNALAAARIAIGQLQATMGPDQRVSMRADMYANDHAPATETAHASVERSATAGFADMVPNPQAPNAGLISHNKRYWTGVWSTGGADSTRIREWNVAAPHETRLFLGWLTSPTRASSIYPDEIDDRDASNSSGSPSEISIQNYVPNRNDFNADGTAKMMKGQALIDGLAFPLLSATGSLLNSSDAINQSTVPLVSRGTAAWPASVNGSRLWQEYYGAVDAVPVPMPDAFRDAASRASSAPIGRFAFWIGDEGIKAKANLPDAYAHTASGVPVNGLTPWERGLSGNAAQRTALELAAPETSQPTAHDQRITLAGLPANFGPSFRTWRDNDIQTAGRPELLTLARVNNPAELTLWAQTQAGNSPAAALAMQNALRALWPDVTTYSYSTLTDVYNGGAKTDLSTAFELPYSAYRTLEMYPDQKRVVANSRQSFFHGAQGPGDLDFNRPNLVDRLGSANQLLRASPRASEWAARYVGPAAFSTLLPLIRNRNGTETPERLGFAYEVALAPQFFNGTRLQSTQVSATGTPEYDALPWRGLAEDARENMEGRIVRGPTWDLYRNWYRLYKREVEAAAAAPGGGVRGIGASTDENTFISRGVEPLTYATGNRARPIQRVTPQLGDELPPTNPLPDKFYDGGTAVDADRYFHRNNLADSNVQPDFQAERRRLIPNNNAQAVAAGFTAAAGIHRPSSPIVAFSDSAYATPRAQTTRTRPTSPALMPSILRFSTIYSVTRNNGLLGVTVDPYVVLHNPYDAAIEFEGLSMVSNGNSNPLRFTFRLTSGAYYSTERMYATFAGMTRIPAVPHNQLIPRSDKNNTVRQPPDLTIQDGDVVLISPSRPVDIGDVVIGGGENDNRSVAFTIVASGGGGTGTTNGGDRTIRLKPGEIRVISTKQNENDFDNSGSKNVSIKGDNGFELNSEVFYKMTPYHNVRTRIGTGERDSLSERVIWNMDFDDCKSFASYDPDGTGPAAAITWTNVGLADPTYAERLNNLWSDAQNARRVRDALTFPLTPLPVANEPYPPFNPLAENNSWDGTIANLEPRISGRSLQVLVRNSGWLPYHNRLVGAEGEFIVKNRLAVYTAPHPYAGEPDNRSTTETRTETGDYSAPSLRQGRLGTIGNQTWNFYLIGKRSIDNRDLSPSRRWFGTPDDNPATYVNDGTGRRIRKYREGTETVNGFNLVDEDLLLNFQAMCSGWPMYSNSNHDDSHYVNVNREWTRAFGANPPEPNYYIRGSWSALSGTVPTDPEFNDSTGRGLELTHVKADTLHRTIPLPLNGGTAKAPAFMVDFIRRAADTTRETALWYPQNQASPAFGNDSNGVGSNLDRMRTPIEMLWAPTTPFMIGHRAQQAQLFGYDGKAHAPLGWIQTQRMLNGTLSRSQFPTANSFMNAYWGGSLTNAASGQTEVILYPLPRRPLLSLSQLGSAPTAEVSTDADLTVGASFAHPGIGDLTRIVEWPGPRDLFPGESTSDFSSLHGSDAVFARGPMPELGYVAKAMGTRPVRNRSAPRVDHAFAANLALWDGFYFSGLNLPSNSYTPGDTPSNWPNGPDLPTDRSVFDLQQAYLQRLGVGVTGNVALFANIKLALEAGNNPLANKRMTFLPDGRPAANLTASLGSDRTLALTETDFPHPKYLARNSLYNGGFNVNSTSKSAWKAVLGAMRGQRLPEGSGGAGTTTALTKFSRAIGGTGTDGSEPWTKHRELTDAQIDELAERVVAEVRGRGPFMSLADFINRRLVNSEIYGLKGALQAAIDKTEWDGSQSRRVNGTGINNAGGVFSSPLAPVPGPNNYDPSLLKGDGSTGSTFWMETSAYPKIDPKLRFPSLKAMSARNDSTQVTAGLGAPGLVTQMDVLNSVGPNLTARSDTFVIRAYGEALDGAGQVIGKAWVEVVVQRGMQYMLPGVNGVNGDDPNRRRLAYRDEGKNYGAQPTVETYERNLPVGVLPTANAANLNRLFGRRFRPTGLRWLGVNEL